MEQTNGLENRGEDAQPQESSRVVRLPVEESQIVERYEQLGTGIPARDSQEAMQGETDLCEPRNPDPHSSAEDLSVGWDAPDSQGAHAIPVGWLAVIVVLLVLLGGWGFVTMNKGADHMRDREAVADMRDVEVVRETVSAERWLKRLEERVYAYLETSSVEEKGRYVRNPERVTPLMEEYYQRYALIPRRVRSIENIRATEIGGRPFSVVEVAVEGKDALEFLLMENCENGDLRFDWESEVNYQPLSIATYIKSKPLEPMVFRAYVERDSFYSYEYADQSRYQAFKLTFREDDDFLFGYAPRRSIEGRGLLALLEDKEDAVPVLLRLRFAEGTESTRSVLIDEVLAASWVWSGGEAMKSKKP